MVEDKFFWTEISLLKEQDVCHGSSKCLRTLNQNAPLIIAPPMKEEKKIKLKSQNFGFSRANFTQEL